MTEELADYRDFVRNSRRLWILGQSGTLVLAVGMGLFARFVDDIGPLLVDELISRFWFWTIGCVLLVLNLALARPIRDYFMNVDMILRLPLSSDASETDSVQERVKARVVQAQLIVQGALDPVFIVVIIFSAIEAQWGLLVLAMILGALTAWVAIPDVATLVRKIHERLARET